MKIILLAFEVESFAICVLAKHLEKDGHEVWIVNCDSWHFVHGSSIKNWYKINDFHNTINFEKEYLKLYKDNYEIDWRYLGEFEKKYCINKNIQQLIMSHHIFGHGYRYPYYTPYSNEQLFYWVELQLKWCERIINDIKPDLIFTLNNNYFIKNIFWQISLAYNIKFLTLHNTRIKDKLIISDNFGYGTSNKVIKAISSMEKTENNELKEAKKWIKEYKESNSFSVYSFSATERIIRQNQFFLKKIIINLLKDLKTINIGLTRTKHYRGFFKSNYMESSYLFTTIYTIRRTVNKARYSKNIFSPFHKELPDRPYIYFPLHTLPESSTLTLSTEYYENDLIRFISKKLPARMLLLVKENPMMIGDRPYSFYKELTKKPNVYLIDPLYSSKKIIAYSRGVVGISGTALLEAALFKKPTHAFGFPEFDYIIDFKGYNDIEEFIEMCSQGLQSPKYDQTLNYVQYMLHNGKEPPLRDILYKPESNEFHKGVKQIFNMLKQEIDN